MYAILACLSVAVMLAYHMFLERPTPTRRIAFVAASALAYLMHYFSLFLPLVQFAHIALNLRRYSRQFRVWVLSQAIATLPLLGWVVAVCLGDPQRYFGIGWIPTPKPVDFVYTLINLTVGYTEPLTLFHWFGLGLLTHLLILGLRAARGRSNVLGQGLLWSFLPIVLTFILSLRRPLYVDRFFIISLAPVLILVSAGIHSLGGKRAFLGGALVVGILMYGRFNYLFGEGQRKEDWRSAGAYLVHASSAETIVVRQLQIIVPLIYYYPGPLAPKALGNNRVITPLEDLVQGRSDVWLVYWNPAADAHLAAATVPFSPESETYDVAVRWISGRGAALLERRDFKGVTVFHFQLEH